MDLLRRVIRRVTRSPLPGWIALAVLALPAGCSTTPTGLHLTEPGRARGLAGFTRVLIPDFQDRVSEKYERTTIDRRQEKRQAMGRAVRTFADELALELTRRGCFEQVAREGPPDDTTLILEGTLWRFDPGDAAARLYSWNTAGNAQVEARLNLVDGATSSLLATLLAENGASGAHRGPRPPETLNGAARRVINDLARSLCEAVTPPEP